MYPYNSLAWLIWELAKAVAMMTIITQLLTFIVFSPLIIRSWLRNSFAYMNSLFRSWFDKWARRHWDKPYVRKLWFNICDPDLM